jgi:HPt (histidine-containing phosphotransfer) domain-containing protein
VEFDDLISSSGLTGEDLRLFLEDLAQTFEEDCQHILAQLGEAVRQGNLPHVVRHAHALKGSAANFRAIALTETAAAMEHLAKANADPQLLASLFENLLAVTKQCIAATHAAVEARSLTTGRPECPQ